MENKTFNEKINLFLKNKDQGNPRNAHVGINLCAWPRCMRTQGQTYACMADSRNYEKKVICIKIEF